MQKPGYERILKEQRDAQNSVSNGGADRKADKGKRHSVTGVFFICMNLIRFPCLMCTLKSGQNYPILRNGC